MFDKEYFIGEYDLLNQIYEKYKSQYDRLDSFAEKVTRSCEHSRGGELLFDGYYNPSASVDILLENANRGKLYKRLTSKSKIAYTYQFDKKKRLVRVRQHSQGRPYQTFVKYGNNIEIRLGFLPSTFGKGLKLRRIAICRFTDGVIQSYIDTHFSFFFPDGRINPDFTCEEYAYSGGHLRSSIWYFFMQPPGDDSMDFTIDDRMPCVRYFKVNEQGKLYIDLEAIDNYKQNKKASLL